jgi:transposase
VVNTRRPSSGLSQTPSQGAGLRLAERSGPAAAPFSGTIARFEGTVNKMIKRQTFGRANTDLLRKRILLAI